MTETASPEPAHPDQAPGGENDLRLGQLSPSSTLSSLSDLANDSVAEDLDHIQHHVSPDHLAPAGPNSLDHADDPQNHNADAELSTPPKPNGRKRESDSNDAAQLPAKRQRLSETMPPNNRSKKSPKFISPPWKKAEADGPTTFVEAGRRKSGRLNAVPIELQPGDRRITRRSLHDQQAGSPPRNRSAAVNGHGPLAASAAASHHARSGSSSKAAAPTKSPPTRSSTRRPFGPYEAGTKATGSSSRTRRRSASPVPRPSAAAVAAAKPTKLPKPLPKPSLGTRRSARHAHADSQDAGAEDGSPTITRPSTRIKIRTRPPLTTLPLVHRGQASMRPKIGPSFDEWFARAWDIPVEDGGMLVSEDGPRYTDEMAQQDAQLILRIEREAEDPGGLLAPNLCSVFEPEAEEEPPRQWALQDHLVRAMSNFRGLMLREQQRHKSLAKRLAIACEAEWRRRNPQPMTAEELEHEAIQLAQGKMRHVIGVLATTWVNVRAEINRRRLLEWEAEEQRRVKAALNQAVSLSEQKLQARQARLDTDDLSDEDSDDDEDDRLDCDGDESGEDDDEEEESAVDEASDEDDGDDSGVEDDSNMSLSDDDEDRHSNVSDEGLNQDELRAKYANLPDIPKASSPHKERKQEYATGENVAVDTIHDVDDSSDESVDMDDDLGSTDDEPNGNGKDGPDNDAEDAEDGEDGEGEDDGDEDVGGGGLLGLFFGKSELKKLQAEATQEVVYTEKPGSNHVEMSEAGAITNMPPTTNGHAQRNGLEDGSITDHPTESDLPRNLQAPSNKPPLASQDWMASKSSVTFTNPPLTNGTELDVPKGKEPIPKRSLHEASSKNSPIETVEDVSMVDAPSMNGISHPHGATNSAMNPDHASPVTEAISTTSRPSRSQSPRTSDTKPSEMDTVSSLSLANPQKQGSRSSSPQPTAPRIEIPFLLRGKLREYQHYGLEWLAGLYGNNTNGILADEMGLGKTIQTIALLAHLACQHEVWGPHLVIVPTSVMLNWEMEFKKWCPGFKILTYYGNIEERKRKRLGWTNDDIWNVCITSYQMVLQDAQVFKRRRWHYMILDEAHNIKNFRSQRWQTLLGFNTHSRLLLTGTPLQNNLTELWSLLYFLAPPENGEGGFADLHEFHEWFSKPESQILESGREQLDDEARALIAKLHKVLRPFLLRRLKADVEKQMPAKYEHVEFCRLSKRQRELYDGFLSRTDTRHTLASGNYMSIINCLMQLRKVCNHPDLFVDRPIMTSFRMQQSVAAGFEAQEMLVRKRLLATEPISLVSLAFLNMVPTMNEHMSRIHTDRIVKLSPHDILVDLRDAQKVRATNGSLLSLDPATVKSNLVFLESAARWKRHDELQHSVYVNALRRQKQPIYGKRLIDVLSLEAHRTPFKERPEVPTKIMDWFEEDLFLLHNAIPTLEQRAAAYETTITKFACVTPTVTTGRDAANRLLFGSSGAIAVEEIGLKLASPIKYKKRIPPFIPPENHIDPYHEARMRLSIQFPDKRLLQYDCGKLQVLDRLLRKLRAGGHRALIFTQMTKVLDILEQFLNIHGHKYLRLDGATKVEQRQLLTDRFNADPRILVFILSTRSGGLGINLTGADTVIFYDQDWNPAMDRQCQDRCHRIGQTRDVHIYRLVSEHTIEANILKKASQKQMLDDVVIQEGAFTTESFRRLAVRDVVDINGEVHEDQNDVAATEAMDRVLGVGPSTTTSSVGGGGGGSGIGKGQIGIAAGRELELAEDKEDVAAAREAEKEIQQDEADFDSRTRQGTEQPADQVGGGGRGGDVEEDDQEIEYNAYGGRMRTIDDYMLNTMAAALEGTPLELPRDKKKGKKGAKKKAKDTRKR